MRFRGCPPTVAREPTGRPTMAVARRAHSFPSLSCAPPSAGYSACAPAPHTPTAHRRCARDPTTGPGRSAGRTGHTGHRRPPPAVPTPSEAAHAHARTSPAATPPPQPAEQSATGNCPSRTAPADAEPETKRRSPHTPWPPLRTRTSQAPPHPPDEEPHQPSAGRTSHQRCRLERAPYWRPQPSQTFTDHRPTAWGGIWKRRG